MKQVLSPAAQVHRYMLRTGWLLSLSIVSWSLLAQDVPTGKVDVSTVSDGQLQQAVNQAQQQGYTQTQIESMARARGYSEAEINTLRSRLQQMQSETGSTTLDDAQLRQEFGDLEPGEGEEDLSKRDLTTAEIQGKIFGAELFNNRNLSFAPSVNIPTPETYQLGAGDELVVDVWGASEKTYQLVVTPEGYVKIPNLGLIYVNGLQVKDASAKLISRLKSIYSGIGDNTYAQVSLGRIRSIKVNMIGEVKTPGTYTISSLSTVLHALYQAGGLTRNGAYRNVEVYRAGKRVAAFDLYDFLLYGKINGNITLEDQDIIKVPVYGKRVKIGGEVKNPAIYELKGSENLQQLIEFAGGFTDEAYTSLVTIRRKTGYSRKILTLRSERFADFALVSGDEINVAQILDVYENRVTITGAVWRPGEYELTDSLRLSELLMKADGVMADAFMDRAQITRINPDLTFRNIEFSVRDVLNGTWDIVLKEEDVVNIKSHFSLHDDYVVRVQGAVRNPLTIPYQDSLSVEDVIFQAGGFTEAAAKSFVEIARRTTEETSTNAALTSILFRFPISEGLTIDSTASRFLLEPFDVVSIRISPYFHNPAVVEVQGEVLYGGKFVIESKEERISDVLRRAGGLNQFAYVSGARITRAGQVIGVDLAAILKTPGIVDDLILQDGDVITIPKRYQTVAVQGSVLDPGAVVYNKTYRLRDYISEAGGFMELANKRRVYVIYANGRKQRTTAFLWWKNFPRVDRGATVVVPVKEEKERMSTGEIIGLTSGVATLSLVILRMVDYFDNATSTNNQPAGQ